jgi:hypothetical protein
MALSVCNGWHIRHSSTAPSTGQWQACRHGVTMCAGSYHTLVNMIQERSAEERARRGPAWDGMAPRGVIKTHGV